MAQITPERLLELSLELIHGLNSGQRFEYLLHNVRMAIPCDAVVLLKRSNDMLLPLAQSGLSPGVLGRRFILSEHPRLTEICASNHVVRFSADCDLPDPYDGLLLSSEDNLPVHACMGFPLIVDDQLLGVLTLDSMQPNAFDDIPTRLLEMISAIAAAVLKTAILLEQLEARFQHDRALVAELTNEALFKDGRELIGQSPAMQNLNREITLVAPSNFTVLVEGETGVGKELVARTLHQLSGRSDQAMVHVNCAAIPENLIESTLFGHVKGAFTGATSNQLGKFTLADHGTLFLDEIGELPLQAQSKLLRAIQNQEIQPIGKADSVKVDVRIIAATNRDLKTAVSKGSFRADLYHRLSVYPIKVPALRDRADDVLLLAEYFCEISRKRLGVSQITLDEHARTQLTEFSWPGNIRELEHVISRAALRASDNLKHGMAIISREHLNLSGGGIHTNYTQKPQPEAETPQSAQDKPLKERLDDFQRQAIRAALQKTNGNLSQAAQILAVDRGNLGRLCKRLGITIEKHVR